MKSLRDNFDMSIFNILIKMYSIKKAEHFSPEEIKIIQQNRLIKLLRHTLSNSKFYREYYAQHGITIENIGEVQLSDLPMVNKKIMMDSYDDFVCDSKLKKDKLEEFTGNPSNQGRKYKDMYQVIHTSGTSGLKGLFVYGPNDWSILKAMVMTRVSKSKIYIYKKTKLAYIGSVNGHYAGISLTQDAPKLIFDFLPIDIHRPIGESISKLNEFDPHNLSGYSSGVYILAQQQLQGNLNIHPRRVMCSGDVLTFKMREIIKKAFDVDPINFYAGSESLGLGVQCDLHEGIHLFNDWHCFEVVDKDFNYVKPGESGSLILTNLYNYTQPLIRYQLDDQLDLIGSPCKCGWPFPLIKEISGRELDFLWFEKASGEKENIHPNAISEFSLEGLEKLQVVQVAQNALLIRAVIRGDIETMVLNIRTKMDEILRSKKLDDTVNFEIEIVNEIENDPKTGKFKLIIPYKS